MVLQRIYIEDTMECETSYFEKGQLFSKATVINVTSNPVGCRKVWPRELCKNWGSDVTTMAAAGLLTLGTALLIATTLLQAQVGN